MSSMKVTFCKSKTNNMLWVAPNNVLGFNSYSRIDAFSTLLVDLWHTFVFFRIINIL